jgi:hypothetical protein
MAHLIVGSESWLILCMADHAAQQEHDKHHDHAVADALTRLVRSLARHAAQKAFAGSMRQKTLLATATRHDVAQSCSTAPVRRPPRISAT